jgi:hypothetical protein
MKRAMLQNFHFYAYIPAKDIARALVLQLRCRLHALPVVPLIARQVSQRAC